MRKINKLLGLVSGILGVSLCHPVQAANNRDEMEVHFLDVGQGLSIFVQSKEETLLYDGGDRSASSTVVSYLKDQGVKEIDYLVTSHYDEDHVSGLIGCLNAFPVKNIIGADYVHDSKLYHSFMEGVAEQGLEVWHPEAGDSFQFGSGRFTILSSNHSKTDSNANSVVIRLDNGDNCFLRMEKSRKEKSYERKI